ncbi:hypothetical protein ILUMI_03119 [Ignelater luminosus]|uniref:Lipocalin/cytosolic fatty-acid binding domain-containing protein n=1 Tax=Ignelater luminosus TaxID=2038154 RepID=A0A8K0DGX7_IGNLU|nr:hypothetical protein ILUMI_03119 [Ignelater luminosus]
MKTSNNKIIFLFAFVLAVFAEDELVFDGKCPEDVSTVENFDYDKFSGVWYEIKRYPNTIISEQCATVRYVPLPYNNYNLTYLSRNILDKTITKRQLAYDKENITSTNIKYDVYFKCKKDQFQHVVLATDYDTYSVVWGCVNGKKEQNTQRLFIYSRTKMLDDEILEKIKEKLDEYGIDYTELKDVEQKIKVCGDVTAEPPIWDSCPSKICCDLKCIVTATFKNEK